MENEERKIKQEKYIHTYASDMADSMRVNNEAVIKVALAEQKKREQIKKREWAKGTKKLNTIFTIIGIAIIILAFYISSTIIERGKKEAIHPTINSRVGALVSYDDQTFIDTKTFASKEDVTRVLVGEYKKVGRPNSIHALFFTKNQGQVQLLVTKDFLTLIQSTIPNTLLTSLENQFTSGMYYDNATPHLFLMFQAKDYDRAFAGTLEWEKTLLDDVFPLFRIDTSGENKKLFQAKFQDTIINNKNARVLSDNNGKAVLYYAFVSANNFVVTDSENAIKEIISRLVTANIKPL